MHSIKSRARKVIACIVSNKTNSRAFDNHFEQGDGDELVTEIIRVISQNATLRNAVSRWHGGELIDGMPAAWVKTHNRSVSAQLSLF